MQTLPRPHPWIAPWIAPWICSACLRTQRSAHARPPQTRSLQTTAPTSPPPSAPVPLRKQLKDLAKQKKKLAASSKPIAPDRLAGWELTVGIEVHARLNTPTKLFSPAPLLSSPPSPNRNLHPFDLALPGARPRFQPAALVPAVRAALALNCAVHRRSAWDRKHYFYQDQPNGYQLTQHHHPFATNGRLVLADGSAVGIKQVQLEQDTAKSARAGPARLIDYARAGAALVEIVTLPEVHSAGGAAAVVRGIRDALRAVGACGGNMEGGELRADVNVSVRRVGEVGGESYAGVAGLGTRTEIKNLNSFRAVEDAVAAERDRQVELLEAGGTVEGETRGWAIGDTVTTRLRGKEGEVDYRYMPDPDLGPLWIDDALVEDLRRTLPESPDALVARVARDFDLSVKDATTLSQLDDGERLEFVATTTRLVLQRIPDPAAHSLTAAKVGKTVANWSLHEIGGLLTVTNTLWHGPPSRNQPVEPEELADIVAHVLQRKITGRAAKHLLQAIFHRSVDENSTVTQLIEDHGLLLRPMSDADYQALAESIMEEHPDVVDAIKRKGQKGKIMFFVGQMMQRADEGTVEAAKARETIERLLEQ